MASVRMKMTIGGLIIIGAVAILVYQGFTENKSYYLFVDEALTMMEELKDRRFKVHGEVVPGTLRKNDEQLQFQVRHNGKTLWVVYPRHLPLPDTFGENIPVIIDGQLRSDGLFEGSRIQAKCASKYEAAYHRLKTTQPYDSVFQNKDE